jgi:hypothetical protein
MLAWYDELCVEQKNAYEWVDKFEHLMAIPDDGKQSV